MAARKSLLEGIMEINPDIDPVAAEALINNGTPNSAARPRERKELALPAAAAPAPPPAIEQPESKDGQSSHTDRMPLTIRFRKKTGKALKNASLDRQMRGLEPYKLQDILELVAEPWLRTNGYLN